MSEMTAKAPHFATDLIWYYSAVYSRHKHKTFLTTEVNGYSFT